MKAVDHKKVLAIARGAIRQGGTVYMDLTEEQQKFFAEIEKDHGTVLGFEYFTGNSSLGIILEHVPQLNRSGRRKLSKLNG